MSPKNAAVLPLFFSSFQTPMRTQTSHVKSSKHRQSDHAKAHTLVHSSSRPNTSAQQPPLTTEEPTWSGQRLRAGVGEPVPRGPFGRRGGFNRSGSGNWFFSTAEVGARGSRAEGCGGACCSQRVGAIGGWDELDDGSIFVIVGDGEHCAVVVDCVGD
jgi:hypothetical protein